MIVDFPKLTMTTPHGETTPLLKRSFSSDGWSHADTYQAWLRSQEAELAAVTRLKRVPHWVRWLWGAI